MFVVSILVTSFKNPNIISKILDLILLNGQVFILMMMMMIMIVIMIQHCSKTAKQEGPPAPKCYSLKPNLKLLHRKYQQCHKLEVAMRYLFRAFSFISSQNISQSSFFFSCLRHQVTQFTLPPHPPKSFAVVSWSYQIIYIRY